MSWDLFVCHASEDKNKFVKPLVDELKKFGYNVWYDEYSLKLGDSLRRTIEKGIKESEYGIVVLSNNFFKKEWPQRELDMLVSLEIGKKHKILPIWLNIDYEEVQNYSLILADKKALKASQGISNIIIEINKVIGKNSYFGEDIDKILKKVFSANHYQIKVLINEAFSRLAAYVGFVNEKEKIEIPNWENLTENKHSELYSIALDEIREKYEIPEEIWLDAVAPIKAYQVEGIKKKLNKFFRGHLSAEESYDLYFLLDEIYDLDYYYIIYGIPNHKVGLKDHKYLDDKIIDIGSRNSQKKEFDLAKAYEKVIKKYYTE